MATDIIYPTIPMVRADPGSMLSSIQALTQCVNLMIVDLQSRNTTSQLQGAHIITPPQNIVSNVANQSVTDKEIRALKQELKRVTDRLTTLERRTVAQQ